MHPFPNILARLAAIRRMVDSWGGQRRPAMRLVRGGKHWSKRCN